MQWFSLRIKQLKVTIDLRCRFLFFRTLYIEGLNLTVKYNQTECQPMNICRCWCWPLHPPWCSVFTMVLTMASTTVSTMALTTESTMVLTMASTKWSTMVFTHTHTHTERHKNTCTNTQSLTATQTHTHTHTHRHTDTHTSPQARLLPAKKIIWQPMTSSRGSARWARSRGSIGIIKSNLQQQGPKTKRDHCQP